MKLAKNLTNGQQHFVSAILAILLLAILLLVGLCQQICQANLVSIFIVVVDPGPLGYYPYWLGGQPAIHTILTCDMWSVWWLAIPYIGWVAHCHSVTGISPHSRDMLHSKWHKNNSGGHIERTLKAWLTDKDKDKDKGLALSSIEAAATGARD